MKNEIRNFIEDKLDEVIYNAEISQDLLFNIYVETKQYDEELKKNYILDKELIKENPCILSFNTRQSFNNDAYTGYTQTAQLGIMGFEDQREDITTVLEALSQELRNHITNEIISGSYAVVQAELPIYSTEFSQGGLQRFNANINFSVTILENLEISDNFKIYIGALDGQIITYEAIPYSSFNFGKTKEANPRNTSTENLQINDVEKQYATIDLSGFIVDNSTNIYKVCLDILNTGAECEINELYYIKIEHPQLGTFVYKTYLKNGNIILEKGVIAGFNGQFVIGE